MSINNLPIKANYHYNDYDFGLIVTSEKELVTHRGFVYINKYVKKHK